MIAHYVGLVIAIIMAGCFDLVVCRRFRSFVGGSRPSVAKRYYRWFMSDYPVWNGEWNYRFWMVER